MCSTSFPLADFLGHSKRSRASMNMVPARTTCKSSSNNNTKILVFVQKLLYMDAPDLYGGPPSSLYLALLHINRCQGCENIFGPVCDAWFIDHNIPCHCPFLSQVRLLRSFCFLSKSGIDCDFFLILHVTDEIFLPSPLLQFFALLAICICTYTKCGA